MSTVLQMGLRVVRGPDWIWRDQDGGEGYLGTVVEIGRPGSSTTPDKTVVVQWDNGSKTNYRVGYQNAYDLRIFDNAQIGIRHEGVSCSECENVIICGIRWCCLLCPEENLCSKCYMTDKHNTSHAFARIDYPGALSVSLPPRQNQPKIESKGIFKKSLVVRGVNWEWDDQDGGEGSLGEVVDIVDWENESFRSVARVDWKTGLNIYRLGHKGKVDLQLSDNKNGQRSMHGSGWPYYRDHLPLVGLNNQTRSKFERHDLVIVDCTVERLKALQEGHGGWNDKMADCVNKQGIVHRITERGDIRVQFFTDNYTANSSNRWTFHPNALRRVTDGAPTVSQGDHVTLTNNENLFKNSIRGHYVWRDDMKKLLGRSGLISRVMQDKTLLVLFENFSSSSSACEDVTIQLDPRCLSFSGFSHGNFSNRIFSAAPSSGNTNNNCCSGVSTQHAKMGTVCTTHSNKLVHHQGDKAECKSELPKKSSCSPDKLVREAAQGHFDVVKEILVNYPDRVDERSNNKTALQVASHEGYLDIVQLLLQYGAKLNSRDEEGDTPLHYACFGNKANIADCLLSKGSCVNALNKSKCSPLHVSVNKQHVDCVEVLLKYKADVNIQDAYGDAALHDAIGKPNLDIIRLLITAPDIDLTTRNQRRFNCLHFASLKGHYDAVKIMVATRPDIVDMRKDDGFAALHLTALNGHMRTAEFLLEGGADPDIRNRKMQTPLHLAVSQGHVEIIDVLVNRGCQIDLVDEDGNCCFHTALSVQTEQKSEALQKFGEELASLSDEDLGIIEGTPRPELTTPVLLVAYLFRKGMSLYQFQRCRNSRGKTPQEIFVLQRVEPSITNENKPPNSSSDNIALKVTVTKESLQTSGCNFMRSWAQYCLRQRISPDSFCVVCLDDLVQVKFEPCGHKVTCSDCCIKMKRCITCQKLIKQKIKEVHPDQALLGGFNDFDEEQDDLRHRLQQLEDSVLCNICMDAPRNIAFLCGHSACAACATTLQVCHLCRKPIVEKINLF